MKNLQHSKDNGEKTWDDGSGREGERVKKKKEMDVHLPLTPLFLHTCDGTKDFADAKVRKMKR